MNDELQKYRAFLVVAEQKAQEDFDKTVLSLSGGALGVSFAFVKDIVGSQPMVYSELLLGAWIAWGASITFILTSFYTSRQALKKAIQQVDAGQIYDQFPGGWYSRFVAILNTFGGLLFFIGVVLIVFFVKFNLR